MKKSLKKSMARILILVILFQFSGWGMHIVYGASVPTEPIFSGIEHYYQEGNQTAYFRMKKVNQYKTMKLENPKRFVVDILSMTGSTSVRKVDLRIPFLQGIRYAKMNPETAKLAGYPMNSFRVVFDLTEEVTTEVSKKNDYLYIQLKSLNVKEDWKVVASSNTRQDVEKGVRGTSLVSTNRSSQVIQLSQNAPQTSEDEATQETPKEVAPREVSQTEAAQKENAQKEDSQKDAAQTGAAQTDDASTRETQKVADVIQTELKQSMGNLTYEKKGNTNIVTLKGVKITAGKTKLNNYYKKTLSEDGKRVSIRFNHQYGTLNPGEMRVYDDKVLNVKILKDANETEIIFEARKNFNYIIYTRESQKDTLIHIVEPSDSKNLVVIDPGHGGSDPGAVYAGVTEAELNLDIAVRMKRGLEKNGVPYYILRESNLFLDLYERAFLANEMEAKLFVSIHNNAATSSLARGTETLYFGENGSQFGGDDFANILQTKLVQGLNTANRGIIQRPKLVVLNQTKMPAALVEIAFMTNQADVTQLKDPNFRQRVADALVDGIVTSMNAD